MLDQSGLDTELARLLHRTERVDLATLRGSLEEVRRARPEDGPTLARILAGRGVLTEAELDDLLGQLGPTSSRLTASFEESTFGAPRPDATQLSRPRPSARLERAPANPPGSTEGTERGLFPWKPAAPAGGGRPSGSWDVRPARVSESAERTLDGWRIGGRIGDYVLESQAGAGAMGVVFIGRHVATGARSAVKTMRTTADEELLERFRREGEAQAKVDGHTNVARVHSMGEAYGRMFIVMELVEGGNLEQRLKLGLPTFVEAARIVAGIARGLAHMHARDVLHRDLKPGNVLFDQEGTPKLVDFGLARLAGASRLTVTGEVIGTPAFMSPEQTSGLHDRIGPWTDVWALGGVLMYVLTGRPPFEGRTALEVITKVAEQEAPGILSRRPEAPQELDALCRRLMCRDPRRRPSAAEAAETLEAIATRQAAPELKRPRGKAVAVLAATAALSLVAGALALVFAPPPGSTTSTATSTAPGDATATTVAATGIPPRRPVAPPPAPVAREPEPAPPVAQEPWVVGQRRRCVVSVQIEGQILILMLMQRFDIESMQRFEMTWRVKELDGLRVMIDATVDRFALTSTGHPPGGGEGFEWNVSYDSQRGTDATSPFQAVIGSTLELTVDAETGRVIDERGAAAVQDLVTARAVAQAGDQRREQMRAGLLHAIPLLSEPHTLRETLNGGLQLFPDGGLPAGGRRWALERAPQLASERLWPAGCTVEVDVVRDEQGAVTWSGRRQATFRPQWPANAQGVLERLVKGKATLSPDARRVASASFHESWRTTVAGQEAAGMRAVYDITIELSDLP